MRVRLSSRLLGALLLGALSLAGGAARAASEADAAALVTVEKALSQLTAVRAEFVQELTDRDGKPGDRAVGTLYLRKPGRFRWDYTDPKQLIISDGEWLWLYDPELQQATRRKVKDTLSQTPAMLLAGEANVKDQFEVSAGGTEAGIEWVRLVPKQNDTDFKALRLGFVGGELRRLEFADKLNQVTRVELTRIERNLKLPDALFRFTAPAGVDVIGPKS